MGVWVNGWFMISGILRQTMWTQQQESVYLIKTMLSNLTLTPLMSAHINLSSELKVLLHILTINHVLETLSRLETEQEMSYHKSCFVSAFPSLKTIIINSFHLIEKTESSHLKLLETGSRTVCFGLCSVSVHLLCVSSFLQHPPPLGSEVHFQNCL